MTTPTVYKLSWTFGDTWNQYAFFSSFEKAKAGFAELLDSYGVKNFAEWRSSSSYGGLWRADDVRTSSGNLIHECEIFLVELDPSLA